MGTVPTIYSPIAGDDALQARVLTWVDGINFLLGNATSGGSKRALAELVQTVAQSLTTAVWTDITFDSETTDYDNGHSTVTNTARYTAQTAGWYQVSGGVSFASAASAVRRGARWSVNGVAVVPGDNVGPGSVSNACNQVARTMKLFLNVGDYVTLQGFQDTGGALLTQVAGSQSSMSVQLVSN